LSAESGTKYGDAVKNCNDFRGLTTLAGNGETLKTSENLRYP
jgi:hypothetical protein